MAAYMYTDTVRRSANEAVRFREIPVCRYNLSVFDEKRIYSPRDFLRIYRDMALIREFETMLSDLKTSGSYQGIEYAVRDAIALDIGREAISVGEAYCLDKHDFLFSSEKNIGDMIAKGLAAIHAMSEYEAADMMRKYHDGAVLSPLEEIVPSNAKPKEVAVDFLLYGILSEIFSKITGFHYGLSDASHLHLMQVGAYPSHPMAAGSAGIAVGAALYKKNSESKGFIVANMSENAACEGSAWEAFCLSASGIGCKPGKKREGLPILFSLIRSRDEGETPTTVKKCISRIAAGLGADMMHAETVNGSDPLAVIDAVTRKKEKLLRGEGPALLELICDDLSECPKGTDPLLEYRNKLILGEIVKEADLNALDAHIIDRVTKICKLAASDECSPRASAENMEAIVFGSEDEKPLKASAGEKLLPEVLLPKAECPRLKAIDGKIHSAYGADGSPLEKDFRYQLSDALFEPILDMFYEDPKFIVCGMLPKSDEVDIYEGLEKAVPEKRFFRLKTSETALLSLALGYAMCGGRVAISLENGNSLAHTADVWARQIAKWRALSGGELRLPLVIRVPVSSKKDAQNADELLSFAAATPGLKVVYPVSPYDAKGLMSAALKENNPVIFFENRRLYDIGEYFHKCGVPKTAYTLKIGEPSLKREGTDLTILTFGAALYSASEAANVLNEYGVSAEIFDACSVVPFDYAPLLKSVEKTGKILIVGEGTERGSVMRDVAAEIAEFAFDLLDAPPITLGAKNIIKPPAVYAGHYYPTAKSILDVIHQRIIPLEGYTPIFLMTAEEKLRSAKKGI